MPVLFEQPGAPASGGDAVGMYVGSAVGVIDASSGFSYEIPVDFEPRFVIFRYASSVSSIGFGFEFLAQKFSFENTGTVNTKFELSGKTITSSRNLGTLMGVYIIAFP